MTERKRRDPRAERAGSADAASGRLRRAAPSSQPARPRKNPHALRADPGFGPSGRARLDPHGGDFAGLGSRSAAAGVEEVLVLANPAC